MGGGAASSAFGLRQAIADLMTLPVENVKLAKHWPDKFEWQQIRDGSSAGVGGSSYAAVTASGAGTGLVGGKGKGKVREHA